MCWWQGISKYNTLESSVTPPGILSKQIFINIRRVDWGWECGFLGKTFFNCLHININLNIFMKINFHKLKIILFLSYQNGKVMEWVRWIVTPFVRLRYVIEWEIIPKFIFNSLTMAKRIKLSVHDYSPRVRARQSPGQASYSIYVGERVSVKL